MTNQIEQLRQRAVALCAEHGVTVAELAGLCRSDIAPLGVAKR